MKTRQALTLALASLLAGTALAERDDLFALPLEELSRLEVEVATGTPKTLATTPSATTLLLPRDFRAMGAQTVEEALMAVPGLHVSPFSGLTGSTRFFIRGIASGSNAQTLFLVNGIPMTTLLQGNSTPTLEAALPIEMVERIEVIRGPGSAVHGPDAFAGVINVVTRDARSLRGSAAGLSAGSFDTARAHLAEGGRAGDTELGLLLSVSATRGDRALITEDVQSVNDAANTTSASLAPGFANRERQRVDLYTTLRHDRLSAHAFWREVRHYGLNQGFGNALDPWGEFAVRRLGTDLTWQDTELGQWDLEAQLAWLRTGIRTPEPVRQLPPDAFPGFPEGLQDDFSLEEERWRTQVIALYHGWQAHRLRFGAGATLNDLREVESRRNYFYPGPGQPPSPYPGGLTDVSDTPAALLPESLRHGAYAFVQDEWRMSRALELTSSLRYGNYSDFGGVVSPRVALVWQALPPLTAKLSYGEAFRAPAFTELYATSSPLALGNPALQPEQLRSTELGLSYRPAGQWSWDVNFYEFRIRDFIDFLPSGSGTTLMAQNSGRYQGRGVEAELLHQDNGTDIRANFSTQQTKSETTGETLGLAPDYQFYLRVGREFAPRWEFATQLRHVGPRDRQPGDTQAALRGYTTIDVTLRHVWRRNVELFLIGRNILDADRYEPGITPVPSRIPLPGANLTAGLQAAW